MTGVEVKAALALLFVALGIVAPVPDVIGGLMLGIGASYAAMLFTPPKDRMTLLASTSFYVKESGAGNTGWVAK